MKLEYPKEWFQRRAELEGDSEVGAGTPPWTATRPSAAVAEAFVMGSRLAFGHFVSLWRRSQGWNPGQLATAAGLDVEEVLEMEHHLEPEPDAIRKLAALLHVAPRALLAFAGLHPGHPLKLQEKASLYGVRPEPVTALSPHEREALEAFMAALSAYRAE